MPEKATDLADEEMTMATLTKASGAFIALCVTGFAGLASADMMLSDMAGGDVVAGDGVGVSAVQSADAALDQALAELEACPQTVLDLTEESATALGILVLAPCHANEAVVMDHSGVVVQSALSAAGDLYISVPMLDRRAPVTVTFENGAMVEVALMTAGMPQAGPAQDLPVSHIQDVAARW
jgi:hypothetical protein